MVSYYLKYFTLFESVIYEKISVASTCYNYIGITGNVSIELQCSNYIFNMNYMSLIKVLAFVLKVTCFFPL